MFCLRTLYLWTSQFLSSHQALGLCVIRKDGVLHRLQFHSKTSIFQITRQKVYHWRLETRGGILLQHPPMQREEFRVLQR
jgi:hypothetical protein